MTRAETLRAELLTVEADSRFTEAVLRFRDGSRLCFCHRVGERWAKAVGRDRDEAVVPEGQEAVGLAHQLASAMTMFRLNRKHLDIQFDDGSRWDESLQNLGLSNG